MLVGLFIQDIHLQIYLELVYQDDLVTPFAPSVSCNPSFFRSELFKRRPKKQLNNFIFYINLKKHIQKTNLIQKKFRSKSSFLQVATGSARLISMLARPATFGLPLGTRLPAVWTWALILVISTCTATSVATVSPSIQPDI